MKRLLVQRSVVVLFIAAAALFLQGCSAVMPGTGERAYSHLHGDLLGMVPESLEKTYEASVKAMGDREGYDIIAQNSNVMEGEVLAYDPAARLVHIVLKKTPHDQTQIAIWIGNKGSKFESAHIYDRIQYYLQAPSVAQNVF